MGRRLDALEELQANLADPDAERRQGPLQIRQHYLARIADTLGITTAQLGETPALPGAGQPAMDGARPNAAVRTEQAVLIEQCAALVDAFRRIQDPQDRSRCLQIVCEAAGVESSRSTS